MVERVVEGRRVMNETILEEAPSWTEGIHPPAIPQPPVDVQPP